MTYTSINTSIVMAMHQFTNKYINQYTSKYTHEQIHKVTNQFIHNSIYQYIVQSLHTYNHKQVNIKHKNTFTSVDHFSWGSADTFS